MNPLEDTLYVELNPETGTYRVETSRRAILLETQDPRALLDYLREKSYAGSELVIAPHAFPFAD